jgi:hypothetical protein
MKTAIKSNGCCIFHFINGVVYNVLYPGIMYILLVGG